MKVGLAFLFLASLAGFVVFLIRVIISLFTKKKLKKNVIGFAVCFFLTIFSIAMMPPVENSAGENWESAPPQESESATPTKEPNTPEPSVGSGTDEPALTEDEKERLLAIDSAIWSRLIHAEKCYDILVEAMGSEKSLVSIYKACGDIEDQMDSHISNVGKISEQRAQDYSQSAGIYFSQLRSIASYIRKYIDSSKAKYLEKAQDTMSIMGKLVEDAVVSRLDFLLSCGFSEEEVAEITAASVE